MQFIIQNNLQDYVTVELYPRGQEEYDCNGKNCQRGSIELHITGLSKPPYGSLIDKMNGEIKVTTSLDTEHHDPYEVLGTPQPC